MLNSARVLILEDEFLVGLDLANAVTSANGVAIGPLPSVFESLDLLSRQNVSAAIVDFRLIDRDATPVVERLVSDGTPMLFYTANELPSAIKLAYPHIPVFRKLTKPECLLCCLFDIINAKNHPDYFSTEIRSELSDQAVLEIANRQISNICTALNLEADYFEKHQGVPMRTIDQPSRFEQLRRIADSLNYIVDPVAKLRLENLLIVLADDATDHDLRSRLPH